MPKKPKRHLTQQRMEKQVIPRVPRIDIRPDVYDWIRDWDGDTDEIVSRYDTLGSRERLAIVKRASTPYHLEAARCIYQAACMVAPRWNNGRAQIYSPRQLLAVIGLRWWLGLGVRAVLTYLNENEPIRNLIFGRSKALPMFIYLFDFEHQLGEPMQSAFLEALRAVNFGVFEAIVQRNNTVN